MCDFNKEEGEFGKNIPVQRTANTAQELQSMVAFIRSENEANRTYFKYLYTWAAGALMLVFVVMAGAVTFFGFRTVDAARDSASRAANDEVTRMRNEVRNRIDEEFKTEAIKQTVQNAAKEQSQTAIIPIIKNEVSSRVKQGVAAEQGNIRSTILGETHKTVNSLKPHIDNMISSRVAEQIDTSVTKKVHAEVEPAIAQLKSNAEYSSVFLKAQSGDAQAFDSVIRLWHNSALSQSDRELAERIVRTILRAHDKDGIYLSQKFIVSKTDDELVQIIQNSPMADERKASLDCLSVKATKKNIDLIYKIMTTDRDLNVRDAGFRAFNRATNQQLVILDNYSAMVWWIEHRKEYVK